MWSKVDSRFEMVDDKEKDIQIIRSDLLLLNPKQSTLCKSDLGSRENEKFIIHFFSGSHYGTPEQVGEY